MLLILAGSVLFALASASAWLSYHAQVAYVLAHNGDQRTEAKVWALLLDAGTAGVSLLRLYETLLRRINMATRVSLFGCITASVVMNLLHTPSRSLSGYLIAAVPPVMYAVFLEHLLTNVRTLLVSDDPRRSWWRRTMLWINFPALMWNTRRSSLRCLAEETTATPEADSCCGEAPQQAASDAVARAERIACNGSTASIKVTAPAFRRSRGPGPKRIAFEAALKEQVRSGDMRLFSKDERERNAAAYQAAASLPAPLSRGAARRYVLQALPRLDEGNSAPSMVPRSSGTLK